MKQNALKDDKKVTVIREENMNIVLLAMMLLLDRMDEDVMKFHVKRVRTDDNSVDVTLAYPYGFDYERFRVYCLTVLKVNLNRIFDSNIKLYYHEVGEK